MRVLLFVALGNLLYHVLHVLVLDQVAFGGHGWVGGIVKKSSGLMGQEGRGGATSSLLTHARCHVCLHVLMR